MARPSIFKTEYSTQVYKLCLLGATDKQLADFFNVSPQTIRSWKKNKPEFGAALKEGKELADADVAQSLYKRACGTEKNLPDTSACIFWLRNRQPNHWKDKPEAVSTLDDDVKNAYLEAMKNLNANKKTN